jgi:hypothetical protein
MFTGSRLPSTPHFPSLPGFGSLSLHQQLPALSQSHPPAQSLHAPQINPIAPFDMSELDSEYFGMSGQDRQISKVRYQFD